MKGHSEKEKLNILMVCDFFYPQFGGCESHIYNVCQNLIDFGHKVVVLTMRQGKREEDGVYERTGIRFMKGGLKVYYMPWFIVATRYGKVSGHFLNNSGQFYYDILRREDIDVVHCHQGTSQMANTGVQYFQTMGKPVVFSEHSLQGFGNYDTIWGNKAIKAFGAHSEHFIACSHIGRENMSLRMSVPPKKISVIPHAVDTNVFTIQENVKRSDRVTVVVVTRLTVRKGADILLEIIPRIMNDPEYRHRIKFLIAGDGERMCDFRKMIEREKFIPEEVELVGRVENSRVPDILNQGDIFLNVSLTEIFCIALLEAAACGLFCVATNVGGVKEVLPIGEFMKLCDPNPSDVVLALKESFREYKKVNRRRNHEKVKQMYNWEKTSRKIENVYYNVLKEYKPPTLVEMINDVYQQGVYFGKGCAMVYATNLMWFHIAKWLKPDEEIDKAVDHPKQFIHLKH